MVSTAADSDSDDAQDDDDRDLEEIHNQALAQFMWPGSPIPRSYQVEAFRQVCEKNTIVSMDTGLGKTLISVMCIDFYLKRNPSKKVLMCVPTVQLAKQQAAYIQNTSTVPEIKVADVTGGTIPATRERWMQLLDSHQVVVATGQLAKQAVADWCYLSLEQLSLLILDECHHAVGRDPFALLMQEPKAWKQSAELPRVLGLTASYLHGRSTDFQGRRQRLEATLRSQLWCADDLQADLQRHRSEQTFETLSYREGSSEFQSLRQRCCEELEELLQAYTRDDSGPLWECRQDIDRLIEKAERAFNQAGFYGWLAFVKTKILPAVHERFREKEEDQWRVAEAEAAWDALRPANSVAASGKLEKLVELLEEFQGAENDANRILVFVAQVDDAYSLAVTINRYLDKPVAKYLSGVNSMTPAEQQKALKAFSDGTDPVMVATPALEEGIDVPSCNVVIRYDAFDTAKSHIQGAGRARKKDARIFYFENNWEEEEAMRDLMKQAAQQPFEPLKEEAARGPMKQAAQRPSESPKEEDLSEPERLLARELAVKVLPRAVSKSKSRPRPPRDAPAQDFTASESTSLTIPRASGTSGARVDVGYTAAYPFILQEPGGSMQVDAYNCVAILQEFVERSDDPAFPIFAREEGIIVRCAAPTKPEIAVTEDEVAEYWRQVSNNSGDSSIFDFAHWLDPDRYQRWSWDETQQHRFAMVVVSRLAQDSYLEGRNRPSDYALEMWPPESQEEWKDPFDENDPWMDAIHTRNGDKAWNKDPFDENDPWMDAIHARDGDKDSTTASHQQRSWQQQWASAWKADSNWWSSRGSRDHRSGNTERDRQSWWQSQGGSSWWQQDNSYAHWDGEEGRDSWSRWTQFETPAQKATAGPWRPKEDEESARGSASRAAADRKRRDPEKVAADSLPTPAPAKLSGGSGSSGGTKDAKPARAILNEFLMAYAGRNLSKGDLEFNTGERKGRLNTFVSTLTLRSIGGKYGEGMSFTGESCATKQEAEHSASYKALTFLDPKGQGPGQGKALKTSEPPAPAALALLAAAPQATAAKVATVANPKGTLQELIMKKTKRQNSGDFSYTPLPEDGPGPFFVRLRIGSFVVGGAAARSFDSKPFQSKTKRAIKEAEEDAAMQALADLYAKEVNLPQQPLTARTPTPAEATGTRGAGDLAKSVEVEEAVYTAVFLDSESQQALMDFGAKSVPGGIPSEWMQFCDHMTICLGSLSNPKTPEDKDGLIAETVQKDLDEYEEGQEFELQVVSLGRDENVLAVGVAGCSSCNRYPHITVATAPGSKPSQSNDLKDWTPLSAEEQFTVKGVLQQKSKLSKAQKLEDGVLEPLPPQPTARVVLVRPDGKERRMVFSKATLIAELIEQHRPAVLKEEEIDLLGPGKMVLLPDMTLEDTELLETEEEVPRFVFRKTDHCVRDLVDEGSDARTAAQL